ncbi:MAG: 3'(2'),5'-bisphosphate nucleotidase CysQ [Desulfosarcina sp.]|nr:3'(2'),5'-bisphosphate nucleotidase CysQ [Desulfobacterales bacterium]
MNQKLWTAICASLEAGQAILEVYQSDFAVEQKADKSPLTLADRRSHEIIVSPLEKMDHPILSEEGKSIPYEERRQWNTFWLIDPLDGTKEFIKRNGEFTVNIALIDNQRPVLGVIYVPVTDTLYFGTSSHGAYKVDEARAACRNAMADETESHQAIDRLTGRSNKLPRPTDEPRPFTIVGSRSHSTPEVERIVDEHKRIYGSVDFISAGSSLKICMVAEGRADLYPRTGPTMEWDTGAGQAIAQAAGAEVVEFHSRVPLLYNKENLLNPWFTVRWP